MRRSQGLDLGVAWRYRKGEGGGKGLVPVCGGFGMLCKKGLVGGRGSVLSPEKRSDSTKTDGGFRWWRRRGKAFRWRTGYYGTLQSLFFSGERLST